MRKRKTTLTVLPQTSRDKRVPKPKVTTSNSDPLSRRGARARVRIDIPGTKTI